jgi:hypothetical protein
MWGRVDWVGNYDGVKTFLIGLYPHFSKKEGFSQDFFQHLFGDGFGPL